MLLIRYIVNSTIIFINELVFIIPTGLIAVIVSVFFAFLPVLLALGLVIFGWYVNTELHVELLGIFLYVLALITLIPVFFDNDFYEKYTDNIADFVMKILMYPFNKVHDTINSIFSITTEMELSVETTKSKFLKKIILFFTSLIHFTKGGYRMISKKTKAIIDEGKKTD
jgi:hypothetical protein